MIFDTETKINQHYIKFMENINLTLEEKEYLLEVIKREYVWTKQMSKNYPLYEERISKQKSILTKLGLHPFKLLLTQKQKVNSEE